MVLQCLFARTHSINNSAPWCGHCKNLAPEWKKAAGELKGVAKLGAVDSTVHQRISSKYTIKGYPTIYVCSLLHVVFI
jgi:thioredoxin-like negative regulator of GroEL